MPLSTKKITLTDHVQNLMPGRIYQCLISPKMLHRSYQGVAGTKLSLVDVISAISSEV